MRISDWSSDVCSSDLLRLLAGLLLTGIVVEAALAPIGLYHFNRMGAYGAFANIIAIPLTTFVIMPLEAVALLLDPLGLAAIGALAPVPAYARRSEEHTSELQSLMRISYAVFCLKKKTETQSSNYYMISIHLTSKH